MTKNPTLTFARVDALLRLDGGKLYWRQPRPRQSTAALGTPAGAGGRLQVEIDGAAHYVHRVVWLLSTGSWPDGQIDHINGDVLDNRIENLRVATAAEQAQNRRHRGVSLCRRSGKWRARIMLAGKSTSIGYFDTEAAAIAAYRAAKLEVHPAWATGMALTASR